MTSETSYVACKSSHYCQLIIEIPAILVHVAPETNLANPIFLIDPQLIHLQTLTIGAPQYIILNFVVKKNSFRSKQARKKAK